MEDVIAVAGFFATVIVALIVFGPFGRAVAASIHRRSIGTPGAEVLEQVDALETRIEALQQQMAELAERQDFTERMVAKGKVRGALGSGGEA